MITCDTLNHEMAERVRGCLLTAGQAEQLRRILAASLYYVKDELFTRPSKMAKILNHSIVIAPDSPPDSEQTRILFLQMNYCRYRRENLRKRLLRKQTWLQEEIRKLLDWDDRQRVIKDRIVTSNMGLVKSMARQAQYFHLEYEDSVSEGSLALLRAVDRFDCSLGYRFSTYACQAILQSLYRLAKKHNRWRSRFSSSGELFFDTDNHVEAQREEQLREQAQAVGTIVRQNLANLSEAEMFVLERRFSLSEDTYQPMTLQQIGQHLDLSKERVRQIQKKALDKVRQANEQCLIPA